MRYFVIGLIIGLLGAILWIVASVVGGTVEGVSGERSMALWVLMIIGGLVMFAGPVTFWIVLPILSRFRRNGGKNERQKENE